MHAVNNTGSCPLALCYDAKQLSPSIWAEIPMRLLLIGIPTVVMGAIAVFLLCRTERKDSLKSS